jgi:uncharacterized protein (TIGR02996 family)
MKWLRRTPPVVPQRDDGDDGRGESAGGPAAVELQPIEEKRTSAEVVRLSSVLEALSRSNERLSEAELAALGVALVEALQTSPGQRLRSTSPNDILLPHDGFLRARERESGLAYFFFSPEVARGQPVEVPSDVFAIATVLWFAATLRHPFAGGSDFEVLNALCAGAPVVSLESLRSDLSPGFVAVLRKAHRPNPAERYQTLNALLDALRPLAGGYDALVDRAFSLAKPTRPARVAMADDEMLEAIGSGDETARLVYADALEERGLESHARWLRLESKVQVATGTEREALLKELAALREVVGAEFLASVGRPAIERCDLVFGFRCPLKWAELERTEKPLERYCRVCDSTVHFADSRDRLDTLSRQGGCVAVDVSVPRLPDEEDSVGIAVMGHVAPRRRRNPFVD